MALKYISIRIIEYIIFVLDFNAMVSNNWIAVKFGLVAGLGAQGRGVVTRLEMGQWPR